MSSLIDKYNNITTLYNEKVIENCNDTDEEDDYKEEDLCELNDRLISLEREIKSDILAKLMNISDIKFSFQEMVRFNRLDFSTLIKLDKLLSKYDN